VNGASFSFATDNGWEWHGTAFGTEALSGNYLTASGTRGFFTVLGSADCKKRETQAERSIQIVTSHGGTTFNYSDDDQVPDSQVKRPAQVSQRARRRAIGSIRTPSRVRLRIRVVLNGGPLPEALTVLILRTGGQKDIVVGRLEEISQTGGTAEYFGVADIQPFGLRPGEEVTYPLGLKNPWEPDGGLNIVFASVSFFLIDPAGNIYDTVTQEMIPDATCFLYKEEGSEWVRWPAEQFGQANPLVSDPDGHYAWLTDPGDFRVKATKAGYTDGWGGPVTVPPEVTDLHIGLTPTTAPAPGVGDLAVSDDHAYPINQFEAGQGIEAHVVVSSTTTSDMPTTVRWTTTDPYGRRVPELSGSDTYDIPPFPADLTIIGQVPSTAPMGIYEVGLEFEYGDQTRYAGTQFWVGGDQFIYLPLVMQ
jgi:hypothetical protein